MLFIDNIFKNIYNFNSKQINDNKKDLIVNANVWLQDENIIYPELDVNNNYTHNKKIDLNGVGLAICGGGSRQFSLMIGFTKGLKELIVKEFLEYNKSK